jgi:hypothetical protein
VPGARALLLQEVVEGAGPRKRCVQPTILVDVNRRRALQPCSLGGLDAIAL